MERSVPHLRDSGHGWAKSFILAGIAREKIVGERYTRLHTLVSLRLFARLCVARVSASR